MGAGPGANSNLGALKRLLDHGLGEMAVFLIALGFAAFGIYSVARAWVNRRHAF